MKYKVGDRVRFRSYKSLVDEFGTNESGEIDSPAEIDAIHEFGKCGTVTEIGNQYLTLQEFSGYYSTFLFEHIRSSSEKWTPDPTKYRQGDNWFTEHEAHIDGQTMTIEEFKKKAKLFRSLAASHSRHFPSR